MAPLRIWLTRKQHLYIMILAYNTPRGRGIGGDLVPVYDFRCPQCGERFSVRTSISDKGQVRCPVCASQPEQIFTALNFNRGATQSQCSTCAQAGCQWAGRQ